MACDALLGKNASISGVGISPGFLRDISVAKMVELIDATGIGSVGNVRERIVQFEDSSFSGSGLTNGTAAPDAGTTVAITTDAINVSGIVTNSSFESTWDGFALVSCQGVGTACI